MTEKYSPISIPKYILSVHSNACYLETQNQKDVIHLDFIGWRDVRISCTELSLEF